MCLAVPGKIIEIDKSTSEMRMAKVKIGSSIVDACIEWLPEAGLGDYVLVHVGMAITKIEESAAMETLELFKEMDKLVQEEDNLKGD